MFIVTEDLINNLENEKIHLRDLIYNDDSTTHYFIHSSDTHFDPNPKENLVDYWKNLSLGKNIKILLDLINKKEKPPIKITGFINTGDIIDAKLLPKDDQARAELVASIGYDTAYREISRLSLDNKQVLIVPGNHDCVCRSFSTFNTFSDKFTNNVLPNPSQSIDHSPRVCLFKSKYGVTAFIGFNSVKVNNVADTSDPRYLEHKESHVSDYVLALTVRFISLITHEFRDRPVVLIACVHHNPIALSPEEPGLGLISDTKNFVEYLRGNKFSLLIHGHFHSGQVYNIAYDITHMHAARALTCVSTEAYHKKGPTPTLSLSCLGVDYLNGGISFKNYNLTTNLYNAHSIVGENNKNFDLISSTQTKPGTMRLLRKIREEIAQNLPNKSPYKRRWEGIWKTHGVIPTISLREENKEKKESFSFFPDLTSHSERIRKYDLLLFLRRTADNIEILLSYHAYKEEPLFSDWDSFLLPSFKPGKTLEFIDHLKRDLLRFLRWSSAIGYGDKARIQDCITNLLNWQSEFDQGGVKSLAINEIAGEKIIERLSPTWGNLDQMGYCIMQANIFNMKDSPVAKALQEIPSFQSFTEFWKERPEGEQKRGFVWMPVHSWREDKKCFYSNGDVMQWLEENIFKKSRITCLNKYWGDPKKYFIASRKMPLIDKIEALQYISSKPEDLEEGRNIVFINEYEGSIGGIIDIVDASSIVLHRNESLIRKLREVPLWTGKDRPYEKASIQVVEISREQLNNLYSFSWTSYEGNSKMAPAAKGIWPAQIYVAKPGLERIKNIEGQLQKTRKESGLIRSIENAEEISLFNLRGYMTAKFGNQSAIDILPPIIELSIEKDLGPIWIINDGLHRVYHAKTNHEIKSLRVVLIWDLPGEEDGEATYPYYAYPTTWESVKEEEGKPPQRFTKRHRNQDHYRDYYRDFGSIFKIGRQGGF